MRQGSSYQNKRKDCFRSRHHLLGEEDGRGHIMRIRSPVLLWKLQIDCLKGTFLGEVETSIRSSFAGVEANDSILALFAFFSPPKSSI